MLKVAEMQLDSVHRDILQILRKDGRASVTQIAQTLGLTRITVKSRIAAMVDAGVIKRFTVELEEVIEEDRIRAISMIELKGTKSEAVKQRLQSISEISSLYTTNGKWGLVASTECRNLSDFDRLLNRIGKIDGVVNVETCLCLTKLV